MISYRSHAKKACAVIPFNVKVRVTFYTEKELHRFLGVFSSKRISYKSHYDATRELFLLRTQRG